MDIHNALQFIAFVIILTICVSPLGGYMERVFSGKRTALDRVCLPLENLLYRITRVDRAREMTAKEYTICFILFSLAGTLLLYGILRFQHFLPWFFPQITARR